MQYQDLVLEGGKKQQLLDAALAQLNLEQANTSRVQGQQAQMQTDYAEIQQELTTTQAKLAAQQVVARTPQSKPQGFSAVQS